MLTPWFIVLVILLIAAYDFWALSHYGAEGTISLVLRKWGQRWPVFPYLVAFAMGALFGHLFL